MPLMPPLAPPAAECRPTDPDRMACFALLADPDPASLSRVLEPFAKRGLVVSAVQARLLEPEGELSVDIQIRGMTREESEYVARSLRTIPLVHQVLTSERRYGRVAGDLAA